jgi:hypothetical protein
VVHADGFTLLQELEASLQCDARTAADFEDTIAL